MRKIYLDFLTQKKDTKKLSYDDIVITSNMSKSKLQRIFTGQVDPTVSDLEAIVEKGLGASMMELYALIGRQEFKDSESLDYKGAKELLSDFNAEKAQIRTEYQTRIDQLVATSDERQKAFTLALEKLSTQYKVNADYLVGIILDNEAYIRDLLAKTEAANKIAAEAQERAKNAEKRIDSLDKHRHQVFWSMLLLVFVLLGIIIASVVLNIPAIGWGNMW